MNPFVNDSILAEKKVNMLPNLEKTSSCHTSTIILSKNSSNTTDNRLSLIKTYSCCDGNSLNLNETNLFITVKQFTELLSDRKSTLPIIDCRSQIDYGCERICSSFNINCRAKLLAKKLISKRLEDIEPNLSTLIDQSDRIILYDQSTNVQDEEKVRSLPIYLVLQAARRSNRKVFIIQGGFDAVKNQCSHLIERTLETPREKHDEVLPLTPGSVDKENFTMSQILPRIFVGNVRDSQNTELLNKHGITHILNCTPDLPILRDSKYNYLRIGVLDLPSQNICKYFETSFQFIEDALRTKTNNVLVHCSAGISRSPTLVLAYMIKKYHMKFDDAFHQMRKLRQIVDPNVSFIIQLRDWEKKCLASNITNETNEEMTCSTSRSASGTYCGSTSKNKTDSKPHADSAIIVN